ncbi:MAG TPA: GNAT family N-acetyltransferase [Methylomusa anaerophila]|uniref:Acetyltransferase (GNAT) family protein n=1 Tax=Methylomusa anaerophila TaxID=1930071 RepID=A0A348AK07_9FIRM|nr:GNAT family N-acetyltransferase [Methylomusa anaerophila]BBB91405.1 acetyltransferase (GNAT) family protein [Methylomusa anaerophila]HML90170.1 GNAT family N-acetyltransferase [Methylomusa anaerophila]
MEEEEIIIKKYSAEYKDEIIDLILDIQQNEFQIPIKKEDQPDLNDIPNFYQALHGNFWMAICNNRVVGTISLRDIGNKQGALRKMFVKAAYRGSSYNIGKLLLLNLIHWAREHYIQEIYLGTTEKFLAAHRFYEKNGFVQIAKADLPDAFPIMKVDSRFYRLYIKE